MEASDITETICGALAYEDMAAGERIATSPGDEDSQFFIDTETGERFLVVVAKVSE